MLQHSEKVTIYFVPEARGVAQNTNTLCAANRPRERTMWIFAKKWVSVLEALNKRKKVLTWRPKAKSNNKES